PGEDTQPLGHPLTTYGVRRRMTHVGGVPEAPAAHRTDARSVYPGADPVDAAHAAPGPVGTVGGSERPGRRPGRPAGRRPGGARGPRPGVDGSPAPRPDRKSTRLNSSHVKISYAVFCLKKKTNKS